MTRQQVWTKSRQGRRCQEGDRSLGVTMVILGARLPRKLNLQEFGSFPDCYSVSAAEGTRFRSVVWG